MLTDSKNLKKRVLIKYGRGSYTDMQFKTLNNIISATKIVYMVRIRISGLCKEKKAKQILIEREFLLHNEKLIQIARLI